MKRVVPFVVAWLGFGAALSPSRATNETEKSKVLAIVIGIDRYDDALIPPCKGAIRDARKVADWFSAEAGWSERNVLRMDNLGQPQHGAPANPLFNLRPTRENLDWAVKDWLGHQVKPNDIVVIYYAGQATARAPRAGSTAGRVYLLPVDATSNDVEKTGWSIDDALDRAGTGKKARVVLWLDTSTRGRGERGMAVEKGAPSGQDWLRALTRWQRVTAWLAADGRPSPETEETGPFVTALLKAMGTDFQAHNLLGCLQGLRDNPAITAQGFKAMGAVGPAVSLWAAGARVVEENPEMIVQAGHAKTITATLVSADNTLLMTASQDSTVRIWKLADRSLVRVLSDALIGVETLAMDRDGAVLIAGDGTGRIFGWDLTLDRPKPFFGPPEHNAQIIALAFLPEGKVFVSLDSDRRSTLWDASGGVIKKLRVFSTEPLISLASAPRPGPGAPALVAAVENPNDGPGSLLAFDGQGKQIARFNGPGGRISALDLSTDGRRLVAGDDKGRVVVLDLPTGALIFEDKTVGPIRLARFSKAGRLLISDDRTLRLVEPRRGGSVFALADARGEQVPGEVVRSTFSDDGRWLATCARDGATFAWNLADPARPMPVALPSPVTPPEESPLGISPVFSPDGRILVLGDSDGGIRAWGLDDGPAGPKIEPRPRILPARGQVATLVPSPSGRYLLEITKDDLALVWDLREGRGCKALPGSWSSGAFLPDESRLVLTTHPNQGGDVVIFDRTKGAVVPTRFDRPIGLNGKPLLTAFGPVVVSKSGRLAAAASLGRVACVWRVEDGKIVHITRDETSDLSAIDFSGDEEYLLTASSDGLAKVWPLATPQVELQAVTATFYSPDAGAPRITVARFCPADPGRIIVGTSGGSVFLWTWAKGKRPQTIPLVRLDGEVNAATFSPDGRWAACSSSREKTIRFWDLSVTGTARPIMFRPFPQNPDIFGPHHGEQVGALAAWPNGTMIVSGGDDAAVKFWDLKDHALLGTLVAEARNDVAVDWLAFTPEGLFDGSRPGEAMVKWRVGDKIVTLEQSQDTHYVFRLATAFAEGKKPVAPRQGGEPPELKIVDPPTEKTIETREVELTIWSGDRDPSELRLYQNSVPVRGVGDLTKGEKDFQISTRPHFATTRVQLLRGENRFYAMASRANATDGRSPELVLRYDGPELPGRVHTLAIGISDYAKRKLKYAHTDAQKIAKFLQSQAGNPAGKVDEPIILIDDEVNQDNINDAFLQLRQAVKGRPQDTVVLFLAGHTDTDREKDQFCLLLPKFPFQGNVPLDLMANRGNPGVAVRGNLPGTVPVRVDDPNVLPYYLLYNQLARLEALQRMIIVDACQAGAILDDPAVKDIQRLVDRGSRKVRNSYLLAARRGEPANEADALQHGLLTYTLLRGLGATGLKPIPPELGGYPGKPSADLNRDGLVTSDELIAYADDALPRLALMFPQLVTRAGGPQPEMVKAPPDLSPELEKQLKIQSAEGSFSLIAVPTPPK